MLQYVVPFVIALVVSYALTPSVKKLAIKIGAVDRPNARKVHTHVIPRLGGLAIYIGFMAAVLFCVPLQHELVGMLLGCTAIVAVGIWDDICNIPAKVKLVGQILAACIPIAFGIQIEWLTNPFGDIIVLHCDSRDDFLDHRLHQYGEPHRRPRRPGSRRRFHRIHFDVPLGL